VAEHRVPNDSIVIRGGILDVRDVREQAEDEFRRCGTYSISVATKPGATLGEIARVAQLRNAKIRKTTVGVLRAWGFDVTPPKGRKQHSNLLLAKQRSLTDRDSTVLDALLDEPETNPGRSDLP
jgi:hypothetical protein